MFEGISLNVHESYAALALYFLSQENLGRRRLAEKLGLTRSKTRTMLNHLRDKGLVKAGKTMKITGKGREKLKPLNERILNIKEIDLQHISVSENNIAAMIEGVNVDSSIKLRDKAVRGGAEGMTVLIYKNGFEFPEDEEPGSEEIKKEMEELEKEFKAEKGFILLISSASDIKKAKKGLWRAVYSLF